MKPCLFFIPSIRSIRKNRRHCTLVSCVLIIGSLLSSIVLAGTTETNYQYDDLGRVKTVEYVNTASHTYTYDAADNRTGKQVVITPDTTPPSQPGTILFSNITATSATATWAAATDDRGAIDSYEYSYNNADPWVSVGAALTVTLTGRAPNTTYNLYVRAKDAAQNSGLSRSGNFKTLTDTLPPIISGVVSCSSATSTSLTVTWWVASDNVAVTDYEYSYNNKINWFSAGLVTTKTISGLAPSTLYTVYVHAKDAAGNISSDISGMCTTSGDTTLPGQPGAPNISNITNTSATATWTAATDDVGVTGYEYKLDSGSWVSVGSALTVNLTGLTRNTNYTFYVRAKDAAGNYTLIPSSKPFTTTNIDTQPPSAPGTPSFSNITNTSATATWAAATDDIGVTGYEYKVDSGSWVSVGLSLTTSLSGLTANTTYTVYVRAKDAASNYTVTPSSKPFTTTNIDTQPPSAPGIPSFSNITNTSATATWTAATDNIGVTGYEYKVDNGSWVLVGLSLTANLSGLTANTTYTVYVRAKDAAGNYTDTPSSKPFTTTNIDTQPPIQPGSVYVPDMSYPTAPATWTAASDNVGVVRYEYTIDDGSTWVNVGNALSTTLSGLVAGRDYSFYVRAVDAANNAGPSGYKGFSTRDVIAPTTPGIPVISNLTMTSFSAAWSASTDNIGVQSYWYSLDGGVTNVNVGLSLSANISGLTPNKYQTIYVFAKDAAGNPSVASSKGFKTYPYPPTSAFVDAITATTATAHWSFPSDAQHTSGYEYSLDGSNWTFVGSGANQVALSGLAASTTYTFRVRTKDAEGQLSSEASSQFTTSAPAVTISDLNISNKITTGTSSFKLRADGYIEIVQGTSFTYAGQTSYAQTTTATNRWLAAGFTASNFSITGVQANPSGSYTSCTSGMFSTVHGGYAPSWSITTTAQSGTIKCRIYIEIREASNPNLLLDSAYIELSAGPSS